MSRNFLFSLLFLLGACATPIDQDAWIADQEARYIALETAYAPDARWEKVYQDTARKVWALGHNGQEYDHLFRILRSAIPVRPFISSGYHDRFNTVGYPRSNGKHSGVDFVAPRGTPVYAVHSGMVIKAEGDEKMGLHIKIRNGDVISHFQHLDALAVRDGEMVKQGEWIGVTGMTGTLSGKVPHLHLTMRRLFAGYWRSFEPDFTILSYPLKID